MIIYPYSIFIPVPLYWLGPIYHDNTYSTAITVAECKLDYILTTDAHILASLVSYGVFIVRIWEKINCITTALKCTMGWRSIGHPSETWHSENIIFQYLLTQLSDHFGILHRATAVLYPKFQNDLRIEIDVSM